MVASFHSLRHTFVSLSANAGVPLPVVQSIVGHCSSAMTRHYYHENETVLRQAVAAIPAIGERRDEKREGNGELVMGNGADLTREGRVPTRPLSIATRLKRLSQLFAKGLLSEEEFQSHRTRILAEM